MGPADLVDHLRDVDVGGRGQVRVREVLVETPPRLQQRERRPDAPADGFAQVRVEPVGTRYSGVSTSGPSNGPNRASASTAGTTSNRSVTRRDASSAVSATSPSPCAKCGSPTYASAPGTCTGR